MKFIPSYIIALAIAIASGVVLAVEADAVLRRIPLHIVLRYFESRGRAEPIACYWNTYKFHTKMFATQKRNGQNLNKVESTSGKFAFGQLPSLTFCPDGNHKSPRCLDLVQSHTILRFLDRYYGTYGPEEKRWLVDMVADGAEDMRSKYTKLVYSEGASRCCR